MRIKHPDTFKCDLCGAELEEDAVKHTSLLVRFTTEQNEGRSCEPYYQTIGLDLCPECLDKAITINASGCMGHNSYSWRRK